MPPFHKGNGNVAQSLFADICQGISVGQEQYLYSYLQLKNNPVR